ncbi:MAG: hypothetical protein A3D92_12015 [Bacteroidetes bacterium RIFCSPHIGHO2_02_FULL_44_7]|nr:MAG: hypothetical protein A3D92_12015 [Bacteroidetes bacterium RIFCSPHIGHO2_02_FULL_44_7]
MMKVTYPGYVSRVKDVALLPKEDKLIDFTGDNALIPLFTCESDCTYFEDDIIHSVCKGKGGCSFYDDIAARVCDGSKVGWTRDYDEEHYVVCPSGSPQKTIIAKSNVECKSENLVKVNTIVNYRGKPVRMVIVTCG